MRFECVCGRQYEIDASSLMSSFGKKARGVKKRQSAKAKAARKANMEKARAARKHAAPDI